MSLKPKRPTEKPDIELDKVFPPKPAEEEVIMPEMKESHEEFKKLMASIDVILEEMKKQRATLDELVKTDKEVHEKVSDNKTDRIARTRYDDALEEVMSLLPDEDDDRWSDVVDYFKEWGFEEDMDYEPAAMGNDTEITDWLIEKEFSVEDLVKMQDEMEERGLTR